MRAGVVLSKQLFSIRLVITVVISFAFVTVVDSLVYKQEINTYAVQAANNSWELHKQSNEGYLIQLNKLKGLQNSKNDFLDAIKSTNKRVAVLKSKKMKLERDALEAEESLQMLEKQAFYQLQGYNLNQDKVIPNGNGPKYRVIQNDIMVIKNALQTKLSRLRVIKKQIAEIYSQINLTEMKILNVDSEIKKRERTMLSLQLEFNRKFSESIFIKFLGLHSVFLNEETGLVAILLTAVISMLFLVVEFLPFLLFHLANFRGNDGVYARYYKLLNMKEDQEYEIQLAKIELNKKVLMEVVPSRTSSGNLRNVS